MEAHGEAITKRVLDNNRTAAPRTKRPRMKNDAGAPGGTTADSKEISRDSYTVGWICALPLELAAARAMLDYEHEDI